MSIGKIWMLDGLVSTHWLSLERVLKETQVGWNGLQILVKKTNALVYFAGASATKKEDKSLKEVTPDFQSWVSA